MSVFSQYPPAYGLRSPSGVRKKAATRPPIDVVDIPM